MNSDRLLALGLLLSLGAACQSVLAASGGRGPAVASAGLLPPASRDIEVQVASLETSSVAYLVDQLSDATGVHFTATDRVRTQLEQTSCGLSQATTIPASEAWTWVEGILANTGFDLGVLTRRAPHLLAVYTQARSGGDFVRHVSLRVAQSELALLEEHPALLVVTWLELPNMDVRQLGNSLRALTTDPTGRQSVVPVGNTNAVILTGTALEVASLGRMLLEMNEVAGEVGESARAVEPDTASEG